MMNKPTVYRILHYVDADNGWISFDVISAKTHEHVYYEYIKYFDSKYEFEEYHSIKYSRPILDEDVILHFENGDKFDLKQPKESE